MGNVVVFIVVIGFLVVRSIVSNSAGKKVEKPKRIVPKQQTAPPQPAPEKKKQQEMFLKGEGDWNKREKTEAFAHPVTAVECEEPAVELDFENKEELKRAVIYSEILNRKYE